MKKYDRNYSYEEKWLRLNEANSNWRSRYNIWSLVLSEKGAKQVLLDGNKSKSFDKNAIINTIHDKS